MQAYVLDRNLSQAPIGVPGDLHLGGAGLARGYLNRPDITADRFIPDPFGSGRRLYRTGDIARFTSDGAIEYLGRSDFQVKVRGFRIELGEIESVLLEHPAVRQAVVAVHGAANVEPHLAAYAVPDGETPPTSAIYEHLRRKLPDYMLPSALVWLDALPLTPNGKIDRKALPEPESDVARRDEDFVGPRTPVEGLVAAVWMDVLGLARIDVRDDFFSLGGHSLLAARVMYRLSDLFRIDLPLIAIFRAPSVEALSRELSGHPDFGAKLTATAETLLALSEMPDVDTSQPVVEERAE